MLDGQYERPQRSTLATAGSVFLGVLILFLLMTLSFVAGIAADRSGRLPLTASARATTGDDHNIPGFSIFWEAWDTAKAHYVDTSKLDTTRQTYGAIQGMLDSLDDMGHTRFLSPTDVKAEQSTLSGKFNGIGAEVQMREGHLIIVTPIDGAPAEAAGLKPGDVITRINGQDTGGQTQEELINKIRGPAGTPVTLTILRESSGETFDVTITRAEITVATVSWRMLPGSAKIAHVRINRFGDNTNSELVQALQAIQSQGAQALVVDVRNNPGGYLNEVINVTSEFIKQGNVLLEQNRAGNRKPYPVTGKGIAYDIPIVVLTNQGSASAAEIFAGAVQDAGRGKLIGQTTFGTGTVLSTFPLSDGSAILLGTSEWLTPGGKFIKNQGVKPDISVSLPVNAQILSPSAENGLTVGQIQSSTDTQLLRGIQELGGLNGSNQVQTSIWDGVQACPC